MNGYLYYCVWFEERQEGPLLSPVGTRGYKQENETLWLSWCWAAEGKNAGKCSKSKISAGENMDSLVIFFCPV